MASHDLEKLKRGSDDVPVAVEVSHPIGSDKDEKHSPSLTPVSSIPDEERIIVTGADAAKYLLPLRDDGDPALTFRSAVIGTLMSAFGAAMNQIYMVGLPRSSVSDGSSNPEAAPSAARS